MTTLRQLFQKFRSQKAARTALRRLGRRPRSGDTMISPGVESAPGVPHLITHVGPHHSGRILVQLAVLYPNGREYHSAHWYDDLIDKGWTVKWSDRHG